jgi:uncharacterized protein
VRVKVLQVDEARKRISLTLRLDDEPGGRPQRPPRGDQGGDQGRRGRRKPPERNRRSESGGSIADALRRAGWRP